MDHQTYETNEQNATTRTEIEISTLSGLRRISGWEFKRFLEMALDPSFELETRLITIEEYCCPVKNLVDRLKLVLS